MNKNVKMGVYVKNGEEISFNFYTTLRASEKVSFVKSVTDTIVDENSYNSIIRDLIFDYMLIKFLTDIDISDIDNSTNIVNMAEDFLNETNVAEIIKANVNELIEELNNAVDLAIEYKTGIHKNPIAESLSHLLNTVEKKVSDIDTDGMMEMAKVISSMSGELTVDKMMEAYSKSDIFKQNRITSTK